MLPQVKIKPIWFAIPAAICLVSLGLFNYARHWTVGEKEPAWSPDGRHIAFACEPLLVWGLHVSPWNNPTYYKNVYGICLKDLTTGKVRWISETLGMHTPAWSADSKNLAWRYGFSTLVLWNMESTESAEFELPKHAQLFGSPSWSQDGHWIFFQDGSIWFNVAAKTFVYLDKYYVSSPSAVYLAFSAGSFTNEDHFKSEYLGVLERSSGNLVFSSPAASIRNGSDLQWNADGSILAWYAVPSPGNQYLAFTKISTGQTAYVRNISLGPAEGSAWSPQGDKFAVMGWVEGSSLRELAVISIDCSGVPFDCEILERTTYGLRGFFPGRFTWSSNGAQLAYQTGFQSNERVWIIDLLTGQQIPLIKRND